MFPARPRDRPVSQERFIESRGKEKLLGRDRCPANNRRMMRRTVICSILCLGLAALRGHAETPAEAVRALVDAERNFSQAGQEKGTRAAFLEFLADDAIVFRPGPVNGKEVWSKRA